MRRTVEGCRDGRPSGLGMPLDSSPRAIRAKHSPAFSGHFLCAATTLASRSACVRVACPRGGRGRGRPSCAGRSSRAGTRRTSSSPARPCARPVSLGRGPDPTRARARVRREGEIATDHLRQPKRFEAIEGFHASEDSRPSANKIAKCTFLPSSSAPPRVRMGMVVGQVAPSDFGGLAIAGSCGLTWICTTPYMPAGYVLTLATTDSNSPSNPVGMQEHPKAQYRASGRCLATGRPIH